MKITEAQIAAASGILQAYTIAYGTGAVDNRQRACVLSIYAVLTAQPERVDAEFKQALDQLDYTALPKVDPAFAMEAEGELTLEQMVAVLPSNKLIIDKDVLAKHDEALDAANAKIAELTEALAEFEADMEDDEDGNEPESIEIALQSRTVQQLQSIAADVGVVLKSGLKKDEIIAAIVAGEVTEELEASLANHPVS